jgi:S-DNA-T family DNA segregation ATPase FtsK/SpoIIIE
VVVINELGDYMMTAGKEFEQPLVSLAQLSRAVGIHVIVSIYRPIPEVLTGSIKANFPCRIAFKTTTERDSRIILDNIGAEQLSGAEMLFVCGGTPVKVLGVNVDEERDVPILCGKLISQNPPCPQAILPVINNQTKEKEKIEVGKFVFQYADPLFKDAAKIVVEHQSASTSLIQRSLGIGYNRASRMLDMLESAEIVSPPQNDTYFRDVLIEDTRELMYKLLDIKMELLKQAEKELF